MEKHLPRRHRHRGQAAIWLLGSLAASAAVMYAVFNTGQVIVGKQRAVNAADASALAGATAEARLLNLMAYANRGVVANEVFLAQLLSLESWVQYLEKTSGRLEMVLNIASLIPGVGAAAQAAAKVMDKVEMVAGKAKTGLHKGIDVYIPALELVKSGLRGAQTAINKGGGLLAEDAARNIVKANKTDFNSRKDAGVVIADSGLIKEATFVKNNAAWMKFTALYENGDRGDGKYILEQSLDRFSAYRPGQPWLRLNGGIAGLYKDGGSKLKNFDRWESEDTLELWRLGWCKYKPCKKYEAVGWGRANADKSGSAGDRWDPHRDAQDNAQDDGGRHRKWSGVPALYDVADKKKTSREELGLDFIVAVARPGGNDFTTTSLSMDTVNSKSVTGSAHVPLKQEAAQNAAFAKARVFFERPRRGLTNDFTASGLWRPDGAKEYGSLYSPYWQARLRDLTAGEKGALLTAMGISPDKALYTPGGQ
ncbi:pilus assembly protein TadG-related protein [Roseateles sp. DC23W]|uniref:Pilus assembly protein TadG-related protein n=1 Tax=Pelomonas dachongensis TaxID=3299029 RepID=A0ABW7EJY2_9BURK